MGGGRVEEERGNHIKKVLIPLVARLNKKTLDDECPVVEKGPLGNCNQGFCSM